MQTSFFDPVTPQNPTGKSINAELLHKENACRWREENRDVMEVYNDRIETYGTFGNNLRRF